MRYSVASGFQAEVLGSLESEPGGVSKCSAPVVHPSQAPPPCQRCSVSSVIGAGTRPLPSYSFLLNIPTWVRSPALPQDSQLPSLPPWVAPCPWLPGDDSGVVRCSCLGALPVFVSSSFDEYPQGPLLCMSVTYGLLTGHMGQHLLV